jgi:hypothetical protein
MSGQRTRARRYFKCELGAYEQLPAGVSRGTSGAELYLALWTLLGRRALPGVLHVGELALTEALGSTWTPTLVKRRLDDLVRAGVVRWDREARLIYLTGAIPIDPPRTQNSVVSMARDFNELPTSPMKREIWAAVDGAFQGDKASELRAVWRSLTAAFSAPFDGPSSGASSSASDAPSSGPYPLPLPVPLPVDPDPPPATASRPDVVLATVASDGRDVWMAIVDACDTTAHSRETWLRPCRLVQVAGPRIVVQAPSVLIASHVEQHFRRGIDAATQRIAPGRRVELKVGGAKAVAS